MKEERAGKENRYGASRYTYNKTKRERESMKKRLREIRQQRKSVGRQSTRS